MKYFVYGEKDPHCGCCNYQYSSNEFETELAAFEYAINLDINGFSTTIIKGEQINYSAELYNKIKAALEERQKQLEAKYKTDELKAKEAEFERLKKELGK